ncbi:MAG: peptidylprolyl isomerase, partial [Pyrinomonadaceae bacterium]
TLFAACLITGAATIGLGQATVKGARTGAFQCTTRMETGDWNVIIKDLKTANPYAATRFEADADFRKSQEENIRQVLAIACQAVKDGVLADPINRKELENVKAETKAVQYDRAAHKAEGVPPFSTITDNQVAGFYKLMANETKFEEFLRVKIELLKRSDPSIADRVISPEERAAGKNTFAKISITESESKLKASMYPYLAAQTALQIKLQQAQFLSRLYAEKIASQVSSTDAEIAVYIAAHPELDSSAKRIKAEGVLKRAIAGEDFAALANEFTDDPGNAGPQGKSGGSYKDVPKGQMIPAFEQGALALEQGNVAPQLIETEYGYHVIKLERKGGEPFTYDVRHILIGTTVKDPTNPGGRDLPTKTFVRTKLEAEKEKSILSKIVADNKIYVAPAPFGVTTTVKKQPVKRRRAGHK